MVLPQLRQGLKGPRREGPLARACRRRQLGEGALPGRQPGDVGLVALEALLPREDPRVFPNLRQGDAGLRVHVQHGPEKLLRWRAEPCLRHDEGQHLVVRVVVEALEQGEVPLANSSFSLMPSMLRMARASCRSQKAKIASTAAWAMSPPSLNSDTMTITLSLP